MKRVFATLMIAVLMASMLVACGQKEEHKATGENKQTYSDAELTNVSVESSGFYGKVIKEFLADTEENMVFSPVNVYMALNMLWDVADEGMKPELLELFEMEDQESCSLKAATILEKVNRDEEKVKSILNNSIETIDGSVALVSSIEFAAKWEEPFFNPFKEEFFGTAGTTECQFVTQSYAREYYQGKNFSAIAQELHESGNVWYILPKEGVSIDELVKDDEAIAFMLSDGQWENKKKCMVSLKMPLFSVETSMDYKDKIHKLGITDNHIIEKAELNAKVEIDEKGVKGLEYNVIYTMGVELIDEREDFIMNRPFMFCVTSEDGIPLFAGVIRNIN